MNEEMGDDTICYDMNKGVNTVISVPVENLGSQKCRKQKENTPSRRGYLYFKSPKVTVQVLL